MTNTIGKGDPLLASSGLRMDSQQETMSTRDSMMHNDHYQHAKADPLFDAVAQHDMKLIHLEYQGHGDNLMDAFLNQWDEGKAGRMHSQQVAGSPSKDNKGDPLFDAFAPPIH